MSHHNDTVSRAVEELGSEFTAPEIINSPTSHELAGTAITALTDLARSGGVDFAEYACRVLAAVAANVGGLDVLPATRPGSWEAAHVQAIVTSTAGAQLEDLLPHRTESVRVHFDAEYEMQDAGLYDQLEGGVSRLSELESEADGRMLDTSCTLEEEQVSCEPAEAIGGLFAESMRSALSQNDQSRFVQLNGRSTAVRSAVVERPKVANAPEYVAFATATEVRLAAENHLEGVSRAFRVEYLDAARADVRRRGLSVEVELVEHYAQDWLAEEIAAVATQDALKKPSAAAVSDRPSSCATPAGGLDA